MILELFLLVPSQLLLMSCQEMFHKKVSGIKLLISKNFPTDPWSIPQTPNQQFMKEFLSFEGLGMSGVCSRGMLGFP